MIERKRIFIIVKTYPTLSKKYDELVCTAGLLEDGSWIRIYPLPFRKLDYDNQYKKYQWIKAPIIKNESDPRPESYKVTDIDQVEICGEPVGTEQNWAKRKSIVYKNKQIYSDLNQLIEKAKANELSLALFKPTKIIDFVYEEVDPNWNQDNLDSLKEKSKQLCLWQSAKEVEKEFLIVKKLPYKFSYKFSDCNGKISTIMIEDWEIGMLYWNCFKETKNNKQAAEKVKQKYFDTFLQKDLHLYLGTTRRWHSVGKNPFVIIGVFYPPLDPQEDMFSF